MITHCAYGGLGGTGSFISELCPRLQSTTGLPNRVVFYGAEALHSDYANRLAERGINFFDVAKKPGLSLQSRLELARVLKGTQPCEIVMHGGGTAWQWPLLRLLGVRGRLILVEHGPELALNEPVGYLRHFIGLCFADIVVAVSARLAGELRRKFGAVIKGKKLRVIPNGVDTGFFVPPNHTRTAGCLLMAGTLNPCKDHLTLLRAVERLSQRRRVRLHIAGNGMLRDGLEQSARTLGIADCVTFHGNLSRSDLLRLYQQAEVFAFATKGEGCPLSLLEAMSCSTPVVASDVPGVHEILAEGNCGILTAGGDADAFADNIDFIFTHPERARIIGENARNQIGRKYSIDRMVQDYAQVLNANR